MSDIIVWCARSSHFKVSFQNVINRGFYMSVHLVLNLLKDLIKRDAIQGSAEHYITFLQRIL